MIALLKNLLKVLNFMILNHICNINIDIIRATKFIKNNQENIFTGVFAFILNASEEFLISRQYLNFANIFSNHNTKNFLPNHNI